MNEDDLPKEVFPTRLREVRDMRKFSQVELGQRAGIPASSVAHFEAGARKPSFDSLRSLAKALSVTTDYLLGTSDVMESSNPSGNALFRHLDKLSGDERDLLEAFAKTLADRKRESPDGKQDS